jgi:hypothetical protein
LDFEKEKSEKAELSEPCPPSLGCGRCRACPGGAS